MNTLRYISFDIRRALKEPTALAVSIALPSVLLIHFIQRLMYFYIHKPGRTGHSTTATSPPT